MQADFVADLDLQVVKGIVDHLESINWLLHAHHDGIDALRRVLELHAIGVKISHKLIKLAEEFIKVGAHSNFAVVDGAFIPLTCHFSDEIAMLILKLADARLVLLTILQNSLDFTDLLLEIFLVVFDFGAEHLHLDVLRFNFFFLCLDRFLEIVDERDLARESVIQVLHAYAHLLQHLKEVLDVILDLAELEVVDREHVVKVLRNHNPEVFL